MIPNRMNPYAIRALCFSLSLVTMVGPLRARAEEDEALLRIGRILKTYQIETYSTLKTDVATFFVIGELHKEKAYIDLKEALAKDVSKFGDYTLMIEGFTYGTDGARQFLSCGADSPIEGLDDLTSLLLSTASIAQSKFNLVFERDHSFEDGEMILVEMKEMYAGFLNALTESNRDKNVLLEDLRSSKYKGLLPLFEKMLKILEEASVGESRAERAHYIAGKTIEKTPDFAVETVKIYLQRILTDGENDLRLSKVEKQFVSDLLRGGTNPMPLAVDFSNMRFKEKILKEIKRSSTKIIILDVGSLHRRDLVDKLRQALRGTVTRNSFELEKKYFAQSLEIHQRRAFLERVYSNQIPLEIVRREAAYLKNEQRLLEEQEIKGE